MMLSPLAGAGESRWACESFERHVLCDPEGGAVFVAKGLSDDAEIEAYGDFARRYWPKNVELQLRGTSTPQLHVVYIFAKPHGGSRCWWSLQALHRALGLPGQPSDFYHKHFGAWQKHLEKCIGLRPPHLRRSMPTKQSRVEEEPVVDDLGLPACPERLLPVYSASTPAILALSGVWAQNVCGRQAQMSADAWRVFVQGMVDTFVLPRCPLSIALYLDSDVHATPGFHQHGQRLVCIAISEAGAASWSEVFGGIV